MNHKVNHNRLKAKNYFWTKRAAKWFLRMSSKGDKNNNVCQKKRLPKRKPLANQHLIKLVLMSYLTHKCIMKLGLKKFSKQKLMENNLILTKSMLQCLSLIFVPNIIRLLSNNLLLSLIASNLFLVVLCLSARLGKLQFSWRQKKLLFRCKYSAPKMLKIATNLKNLM